MAVLSTPPPFSARKQSIKVNWSSACGLFLLAQQEALVVGPYANIFKLSSNTTLSYAIDIILLTLG